MAKKMKAKAKTKARRGAKRAAAKGRRAVKARKTAKKPAKGARSAKKRATPKAGSARKVSVRPASRKPAVRASAGGEMFGEGNWKADAQYRESLRKFAKTHDVEALARKAALDLEPDLRDSSDEDVAESARRGAEEEPEW